MFYILIDTRETELYNTIHDFNTNSDIIIEYSSLHLGDIHILNEKRELLLLIERKSINDLASSICDGRYKEQSMRLFHYNVPNHNIIYLIEGKVSELKTRFSRIKPQALYSSMIVLQFFKGFSVFRTLDKQETVKYLLYITDKLKREKNKCGYYNCDNNNDISQNHTIDTMYDYCTTIQSVKKDNLNPQNIHEIMLAQIPNVSTTTAKAVMTQFKTLKTLIETYQENPDCLNDIKTPNNRRITSTAKKNIIDFILTQ